MYRQYFSAQQNRRRAFTLVELIVALALFAIVAGSVLTFILFINKFGDESEKQADRTYALTAIRAETDYWFSYFDRSDFSVTVAADGSVVVVSAAGEHYTLSFAKESDGKVLLFTYPTESGRGTLNETENRCEMRIDASPFTGVRFYAEGSGQSSVSSQFRFTVRMRVTQQTFACEILEEEAES